MAAPLADQDVKDQEQAVGELSAARERLLEEVGKIFKVTRERVRQVEAKAIRKLQHPVRARGEGLEHEGGVDPARAHDAHDPEVGRIGRPRGTRRRPRGSGSAR